MTENERLLLEALQKIEARLRATEIGQQLICMHLSQLDNEFIGNIADTFENISASKEIQVTEEMELYFSAIASQLRGAVDSEIRGLLFAEQPKDPIPWLKGVINGGKSS